MLTRRQGKGNSRVRILNTHQEAGGGQKEGQDTPFSPGGRVSTTEGIGSSVLTRRTGKGNMRDMRILRIHQEAG